MFYCHHLNFTYCFTAVAEPQIYTIKRRKGSILVVGCVLTLLCCCIEFNKSNSAGEPQRSVINTSGSNIIQNSFGCGVLQRNSPPECLLKVLCCGLISFCLLRQDEPQHDGVKGLGTDMIAPVL